MTVPLLVLAFLSIFGGLPDLPFDDDYKFLTKWLDPVQFIEETEAHITASAGLQWLLAMRQDDGGWTIPMITHKLDRQTQYRLSSEYAEPLEPDRSKPFSHNATGMILRAFAAHPKYRKSKAAKTAAQLLASRFFQPDAYTSYQAASYWVRFEYPFWWNQLVAALDSVSLIRLSPDDELIARALNWLIAQQQPTGLWRTSYVQPQQKEKETAKVREMKLWIGLAICRVFKQFER
ncbi:MAG: hypothetical protein HGB05_20560, partial [Chloroflexi bacterium]|nr:hypothetical protein [Chloroflexota bacterium]